MVQVVQCDDKEISVRQVSATDATFTRRRQVLDDYDFVPLEASLSVQDAEDIVMESTGILPQSGLGWCMVFGDMIMYVVIISALTLLGFCLEVYVFLRPAPKAFEETFPLGVCLILFGLLSSTFRLLIYVTLPGLCSGTGQSILCCIISACMFNGPFDNIYRNFDMVQLALDCGLNDTMALSESATIALEHGRDVTYKRIDSKLDSVRRTVRQAEQIFHEIGDTLETIADLMKPFTNFLASITEECEKIVPGFATDLACNFPEWASDRLFAPVERKVMAKIEDLHEKVYYKIERNSETNITETVIGNYEEKMNESMQVLNQQMGDRFGSMMDVWTKFILVVSFVSFFVSFFFAYRYYVKYMSKDNFDNCWITNDFEDHDEEHREEDQLLPLGFFERRSYLYTSSLRLTKTETTRLIRSVMALVGTLTSTGTVFFVDYTFTLALKALRVFIKQTADYAQLGQVRLKVYGATEDPNDMTIMASLFQEVADAFQQQDNVAESVDTLNDCFGEPSEMRPQFRIMWSVFSALLILNAITAPWVSRLRRAICAQFRPERERQRINWLRMSISMTRGKSYARRLQVYFQWTSKNGMFGWLCRQVTGKTHFRCVLCLIAGSMDDAEKFLPCVTPGCNAQYCVECLPFLDNTCTRCRLHIVRVDGDDEDDVSDDDGETNKTRILRYVT